MGSPTCVLRLKMDPAQKSHTTECSRGGPSSSKERVSLMTRSASVHSEPRRTRKHRGHVIKSRSVLMAKSFLAGEVDFDETRLRARQRLPGQRPFATTADVNSRLPAGRDGRQPFVVP